MLNADWPNSDLFFARRIDLIILLVDYGETSASEMIASV